MAVAGFALLSGSYFLKPPPTAIFGDVSPTDFSPRYHHRCEIAPDGQTVIYGATWSGIPALYITVRKVLSRERLACATPAFSQSHRLGRWRDRSGMQYALGRMYRYLWLECLLLAEPLGEIMENVNYADWAPDGKGLAVVSIKRKPIPPGIRRKKSCSRPPAGLLMPASHLKEI